VVVGVVRIAIGWGVYNPHSLYRIRLLNHRFLQPDLYRQLCDIHNENDPNEARIRCLVEYHVANAVRVRQALGLIPSTGTAINNTNGSNGNNIHPQTTTNTYRLVNGEGDHLSGLAVDVINTHAVVMSSAGWCERYRDVIEEVLRSTLLQETTIVWKTTPARLKQDGYRAISPKKNDNTEVDKDTMVVSLENGLEFETYPAADGQKTGVYCDQRENRARLASYCRDKRVLDLCCFTGGFSLLAAADKSVSAAGGGAAHCTGVDSSPVAIVACRANAKRNQLSSKVVDFVQSDITTFLQQASSSNQEYDVVVLDPPKLAPSAKLLDKARRKYHSLNRDAIKVVDRTHGGLFLTCTCSAAMTQAEGGQYFLRTVQAAALSASRTVTLLSAHGAAACHTQSPAAFPASAYLTAALFYVHPAAVSAALSSDDDNRTNE